MEFIRLHRHLFGYIALVIVIIFLFSKVNSEQNQITSNVHAQLANRVANVTSWCNGINDTRNYERNVAAVLLAHHPLVTSAPIVIANLNCQQLEMKTAKSGTKKS